MKFCVDCKHCRLEPGSRHHECARPKEQEFDLVTGDALLMRDICCEVERWPSGDCGPEGRFFESKSGAV